MNPYDLSTVLLAKHAQHVVLIHFPIALFLAGVGFDLAAAITRRTELAAVAYYNLMFAAITALPAAATGLLAWQWELEGKRLTGILLYHLLAASASLLLIWIVWRLHARKRRQLNVPPALRGVLEALGVVLVALTGHLGGFLSGVNHP
jgi:uncharacterized membrane protein